MTIVLPPMYLVLVVSLKAIKESVYEENIDLKYNYHGTRSSHYSNNVKNSLMFSRMSQPYLTVNYAYFKPYEITFELKDPTQSRMRLVRALSLVLIYRYLQKETWTNLCKQDVLEPAERSEWIAGSFIVPKSDAQARWVTDFRHLNSPVYVAESIQSPRFRISLSRCCGYKWVILYWT